MNERLVQQLGVGAVQMCVLADIAPPAPRAWQPLDQAQHLVAARIGLSSGVWSSTSNWHTATVLSEEGDRRGSNTLTCSTLLNPGKVLVPNP